MERENFYTKLDTDEKFIMNAVFYVFFVNGIFAMVMGSLLPLISQEYGLSDTVSGALISAHSVGNLISGFIAGILPAYLGRKRSIIVLSSFVTMGFIIMITTGSTLLLLTAFLFTGLSRGSVSNFNNTMVNEVSDSSPVGFVGSRFKKEHILLVTTSSTVVFYFLLLSTTNVTVITIAIIGIGLSMAGIYPTTVSNVGKTIKDFPMAMGVLLVLGGTGAIVMPMLTGALSDKFGIFAGMSAIVVALILMMVCVVLLMLGTRRAETTVS